MFCVTEETHLPQKDEQEEANTDGIPASVVDPSVTDEQHLGTAASFGPTREAKPVTPMERPLSATTGKTLQKAATNSSTSWLHLAVLYLIHDSSNPNVVMLSIITFISQALRTGMHGEAMVGTLEPRLTSYKTDWSYKYQYR